MYQLIYYWDTGRKLGESSILPWHDILYILGTFAVSPDSSWWIRFEIVVKKHRRD